MQDNDVYEVYAVKYGETAGRTMAENYIGGDPHDTSVQLDYYVWAIVGRNRTFVVDTGFNHETAGARGRKIARLPKEGLAAIGVDANTVKDVVITHLHYDHAGTLTDFPNARFHLSDEEMSFATGRFMCHHTIRMPYEAEDVCTMVRKVYKDEVQFHDQDGEIAPGVSVHAVGGHAKGLMCVRVNTRRGAVVLASDASHLYMNMELGKPFPIVVSVADMMESWKKLGRLADSPKHIIPGHDPLVMHRFPTAASSAEGIAVRLDGEPLY